MQSKFSIAKGIVNNRIRSRLINVQIKENKFYFKREKREKHIYRNRGSAQNRKRE